MPANDVYDCEMRIGRLRDACMKQGWKLVCSPGGYAIMTKGGNKTIVGVIGHFNAGKSFVLSLLAHRHFPQGDTIHTEGLSFVEVEENGLSFHLLDTQGTNTPVENVEHSNDVEASRKLDEIFHAIKSREDFIRSVTLKLSDVFLYVTPHLSWKDQVELHPLDAAGSAA